MEVEGRAPLQPGPSEDSIAGAYFETAGIPLKKGRLFTDEDRVGTPAVAIINERMAKTYWPGEDAIGKRFRLQPKDAWATVVGITGDMHRQGLEKQVTPQVFFPHAQNTDDMWDVIVRTSAEFLKYMAAVVREAKSNRWTRAWRSST